MLIQLKRAGSLVDCRSLTCIVALLLAGCSDGDTAGSAPNAKPTQDSATGVPDTAPDTSRPGTSDSGAPGDAPLDAGPGDDAEGRNDAEPDGTAADAGSDGQTSADAPPDTGEDAAPEAGDAGLPDAPEDAPDATDGAPLDAAPDARPRCETLDCNDGVACTVDSCDETAGCIHLPTNALCDDHQACTGTETCDAVLGCQHGTPLDCADSNRCTFDYCAEPAGCAHQDVSRRVELLINPNFELGRNVGWRELTGFAESMIWDAPAPVVAHTPNKVLWLGSVAPSSMQIWQQVAIPAETAELTLSGVYLLLPNENQPGLNSRFRVELHDALSTAVHERALNLTTSDMTGLDWVPFSVTAARPHAGEVVEVMIFSSNPGTDDTNFFVDSMSLEAKLCPSQ